MLNERQRLAVAVRGDCVIAAPPGSGKTSVLAARAERLLTEDRKTRLAAVTFTVDAARELGERIIRRVPDGAGRIESGTFHKLAKQQIERSGIRLKLVGEHHQRGYIARALRVIEKRIEISGLGTDREGIGNRREQGGRT